ncbi:MAG: hypothetical protein MUO34_15450 [Ignavibacteriaceae bacterium]|nr:hypothetical protein [Ignavibacteriaceae bacterium]
MKKFFSFFFLVLLFGSITLNAQYFATKGTIELGGSAGFSSSTSVDNGETAEDAFTTFNFAPYVGYFVVNSLELGLIPSFVSQSFGDNYSANAFGVYFAPAWNFDLKSNLFPFIEGRIGYNTTSTTVTDGEGVETEFNSSGLAWGLRGGLKVQVGNSALVNLALFYDQLTMDPDNWDGDRNGENVFGVNVGFTIFWGR